MIKILKIVFSIIFVYCSCTGDSNEIDEGTFYCKIDGTPFKTSGAYLTGSVYLSGFKIIATEKPNSAGTTWRNILLFVPQSSTGIFDLGPNQSPSEVNWGEFIDYLSANNFTSHLYNKGSGYVNLTRNDGKVAIGTFEMNVSNGSRVLKITDGKFHVRYLK